MFAYCMLSAPEKELLEQTQKAAQQREQELLDKLVCGPFKHNAVMSMYSVILHSLYRNDSRRLTKLAPLKTTNELKR